MFFGVRIHIWCHVLNADLYPHLLLNSLGLSFQDFYQQCREAFLVNSDLTLRAQLTEFRDHKLIRTKKGTDGVEYLLIPIDNGTLTDFLEKEEEES